MKLNQQQIIFSRLDIDYCYNLMYQCCGLFFKSVFLFCCMHTYFLLRIIVILCPQMAIGLFNLIQIMHTVQNYIMAFIFVKPQIIPQVQMMFDLCKEKMSKICFIAHIKRLIIYYQSCNRIVYQRRVQALVCLVILAVPTHRT